MPEIEFWVEGDFAFSIWKGDELDHLCGYLGIPRGHPWWGQWGPGSWESRDFLPSEPSVHGGVTWAAPEDFHWDVVGPVPKDLLTPPVWTLNRNDEPYPHGTGLGLWWIGFDCAHYMDKTLLHPSGIPRDIDYVKGELRGLAAQAARVVREAANVD